MIEVSATTVRRLAFVRYLFNLGSRQVEVSPPFGAAALLMFHDSVELFLQIVSEFLDAGGKQVDFMAYWDLLSAKLPEGTSLGHKEAMRRLNKARVALKHHGITPSGLDVKGFAVTVRQFLEETTDLVFGLELSQVSLVEFVKPEAVKERLGFAQKWVDAGKPGNAVDQAAMAFELLLHDYEERKKRQWYDKSPFFFGDDLRWMDGHSVGLRGEFGRPRLADFVDKVSDSLQAIRDAVRVLALGIDYRRYSRFRLLTPEVKVDGKDEPTVWRVGSGIPKLEASVDDAAFCIEFVIEAAVQLQEFDYSLTAPEVTD